MSKTASLLNVPSTVSTLMEQFDLTTNFSGQQNSANNSWVYTHISSDAAHPTTVTFQSSTFTRNGQSWVRLKISTQMWVKITDTLSSDFGWEPYKGFCQFEFPVTDTTAIADIDKFIATAVSSFYNGAAAGVRDTGRLSLMVQAHSSQVS